MNKFKIGDKVRYDGSAQNCSYYRDRLKAGEVYTILNFTEFGYLNFVECPDAEISPYRFTLVESSNINNKMNKEIAFRIEVNGDEKLFRFFESMAYENGFKSVTDILLSFHKYFGLFVSIDTKSWGKKILYRYEEQSPCSLENFPVYKIEDYTKIVELFKQKPEPKLSPPIINGYKMEYKKGDKVIKFGCAEIYYGMLVSLSNWGEEHRGNRKLKSITLNSGVTMTIDEIDKVLEYRKYVMENT